MLKMLYIGLAGLLGTVARYGLSGWVDRKMGGGFPVGTLTVNLAGCFLAGFLYQLLEHRFLIDPALRSVILIGFLGGFTTFSSYGVQTFTLALGGQFWLASVNVLASNVGGLLLLWIGYISAKAL
jgi:fluoride exporter